MKYGIQRFFQILTAAAVFAFINPLYGDWDAGSRASFTRGGWVGARYVGMGKAAEVTADDVFALYWNPAGLAGLRSRESLSPDEIRKKVKKGEIKDITEKDLLKFSEEGNVKNFVQIGVSAGMLDIEREAGFAGAAFNLFSGVAGVGVYTIQSRDIEARDETGALTGNLNYIASAGHLSYAWNKGVASLGITLKALQEKIGESSYYGSGCDFGAIIDVLPVITLGFVIQDIGTNIYKNRGRTGVYDNLDFGYPTLKLGASFTNRRDLVISVTGVKKLEQEDYVVNAGLEYRLSEYMTVCTGINDKNFSAGFSVRFFDLDIGYAFAFDNINMGYNNIVSVTLVL